METTINERIESLTLKVARNQSDFARKIGKPSQTISNIIAGRCSPSFDIIQGILRNFPEIDPTWLILGKGVDQPAVKDERYMLSLEERIAELKDTIRMLGKAEGVPLYGKYSAIAA